MSVTPGVTKTRTIAAANGLSLNSTVASETKNAPTPLEYGRQIQSDGLSARGEA